jgi:hypothetical protein
VTSRPNSRIARRALLAKDADRIARPQIAAGEGGVGVEREINDRESADDIDGPFRDPLHVLLRRQHIAVISMSEPLMEVFRIPQRADSRTWHAARRDRPTKTKLKSYPIGFVHSDIAGCGPIRSAMPERQTFAPTAAIGNPVIRRRAADAGFLPGATLRIAPE